jgi:hypothetical protein
MKPDSQRPLFEAGFMKDSLFARTDILRPVGDTFDMIEVKSGTRIKDENIDDVSFQKHVCEKAGLKINKCFLCFINNEYVKDGDIETGKLFRIEDITEQVIKKQIGIQDRIDTMFDIINSPEPSITIGRHCSTPYPCELDCWDLLPENNVFDLYRGKVKSIRLFEDGIQAISDIPDDFSLTQNQAIQKECEKTGSPHIDREKIKSFLDTLEPPLHCLDFETINPAVPRFDKTRPYQKIPFQFSLHIGDEHISFLARDTGDPRPEFLSTLKNSLKDHGSIVVYNESFEKGVLRDLAKSFPEYAEWVESILPRIVDLIVPFRNFWYYHPKQHGSASIKKVLPALTGKSYESMDIGSGSDASISYEIMAFKDTSDEEKIRIRKSLEEYCKLDTLAEIMIIDELKRIAEE